MVENCLSSSSGEENRIQSCEYHTMDKNLTHLQMETFLFRVVRFDEVVGIP